MKNIFLSASIPLVHRHPKYHETADVIAIRDAVIALASTVLSKHRLIWGGHPSITPLINYVIERKIINKIMHEDREEASEQNYENKIRNVLQSEIQNHVLLYQSLFFKDDFPPDNNRFENLVVTENAGDIHSSIQLMRIKMLSEHEYAAAIFIGGMDGIEVEFNMFKEKHPKALLLPIASTSGATQIVYENLLEDQFKNERLVKDYGYMSLFQKLLLDKI